MGLPKFDQGIELGAGHREGQFDTVRTGELFSVMFGDVQAHVSVCIL